MAVVDSRYALADFRGMTACTPNQSEVEAVLDRTGYIEALEESSDLQDASRVETHGIEKVPDGRVLLIGNHAGNTLPMDGAMPASINASMTPTCAHPRAKPLPRARPIRGRVMTCLRRGSGSGRPPA